MIDGTMTIRVALPRDATALRRLAALDSAGPLSGHALIAELDGAPVAAMAIATGTTVADPFQPSADAVRMLLLRRNQVLGRLRPATRDRVRPRPVAQVSW
jgi:hypothetical protein